jgi:hypothetical protein
VQLFRPCFDDFMGDKKNIASLRGIYQAVDPLMDERARRCWAAAEALASGWGGIRAGAAATGLSPNTIWKGRAGALTRWAMWGQVDQLTLLPGVEEPHAHPRGAGRLRMPQVLRRVGDLEEQPVRSLLETNGDPKSLHRVDQDLGTLT